MQSDSGSARQEAERLVATALAVASMAARRFAAVPHPAPHPHTGPHSGPGPHPGPAGPHSGPSAGPGPHPGPPGPPAGPGEPTSGQPAGVGGGAECAVCPICRAIVALRDPSPEFAERLATGAGDLAAGLASLLRAFSAPTTDPPSDDSPTCADPTAAAGRAGASAGAAPATAPRRRAPMAKKAVRPARHGDGVDGG